MKISDHLSGTDHIKSRKLEDYIQHCKAELHDLGLNYITQDRCGDIYAFKEVPDYYDYEGLWLAEGPKVYIDTVPLDTIVETEYMKLGDEDEN